jgi:nucleotide-binding universal stress UspA family protein
MSTTVKFSVLFGMLLLCGMAAAVVMGRRGHHPFTWGVLGTAFGPLVIPVAIQSVRRERLVHLPEPPSDGPLSGGDVLVGVDGSAEATAALLTVVDLLGPGLRRLTLATVIDYDTAVSQGPWQERHDAEAELDRAADLVGEALGRRPDTIVLAGRPAEALVRHATEGGYRFLAIGSRGRGASRLLLGSVASQLARHTRIPVLIVGGGARTPGPSPLTAPVAAPASKTRG